MTSEQQKTLDKVRQIQIDLFNIQTSTSDERIWRPAMDARYKVGDLEHELLIDAGIREKK